MLRGLRAIVRNVRKSAEKRTLPHIVAVVLVAAGLAGAAGAALAGALAPQAGFDGRLEAAWRAELSARAAGRSADAPVDILPADDAAGGCDGVINGGFGFHTAEDDQPWWQVDLGSSVKLDRVVVYNRCTISDRPSRLHLLLSDDGKAWKMVYRHNGQVFLGKTDGKPLVVPAAGEAARFVRVQLPQRTWLHLDEIEVYGADEPRKNIALKRPADQSSASQWSNGPRRRPAGPPAALAVPAERYAEAVREVLERGRLLAADLASGGVDAVGFHKQAGEIAAALEKGLPPGGEETKTLALYLRAQRAVRALALRNPLLGFDKLLLIRRGEKHLGLPANWQSNSCLPKTGYDNDLALLSGFRESRPAIATLYRPDGGRFIGDVDLHFDGSRMIFSMPEPGGQWQVFELVLRPDGTPAGPPQVVRTIQQPDVGNYDACYLSDGNIIFCSTAPFIGVPCVRGSSHVTNLYLLDRPSGNVRRLTFDQDHDWCPAVMPTGRIMYLRWEYSDLPHSNSRRLFQMSPDGTGQMELYGSNSYWPNSLFYARPVPGHPSRLAGIVTGHHGVARMGELVLLDPARGRQETEGAIQRIPGRGKPVEPIIRDQLVDASWPKFLHPWPLGSVSARPDAATYLLTACKPSPAAPWGIYLVDTLDNMILLAEEDGYALLEPVPLQRQPVPPVIAAKVDVKRPDAVVHLVDVYRGGGLAGIPRGTVKKLRLVGYHFSFHGVGGLLGVVGADGPWDIKRVIGTVPVEADGSAVFRIPANTPVSLQPLDERGQALQLMRSWLVGMPGEVVACVGCHERLNETPPAAAMGLALRRNPAEIEPWRGPVRGFSYAREVQGVVDRHCVGCHSPDAAGRFDAARMPDLRGIPIQGWQSEHSGNGGHDSGKFSVGYNELCRYIRRPGIESDIHLLTPMEFHASTTELVQMLRKGHHGVRLDGEAWDRLITWIDLNAPYHGTWTEIVGPQRTEQQSRRRAEMSRLYAGIEDNGEAIPDGPAGKVEPIIPPADPPAAAAAAKPPDCPGWPFDAAEARRRQEALGETRRAIDLGDGISLELALIPPGEFVMGSTDPAAPADERPATRMRIDRPFWLGKLEVTNEQYARFDALHDSHVESKHGYQFGIHGYPVNGPRQPVVRVSWEHAAAFCRWLTVKAAGSGLTFALPTEAQWEYACRAGSAAEFSYGGMDVDFSKLANLGDAKLREFATNPYTVAEPMKNPNRFDDWLPKDERFNDGALVSADVGSYQPNAWGLHDMHGNVAEWTRTVLCPYPYRDEDGRSAAAAAGDRVVRGGSWYDRPKRCRSPFRLAYPPHQRVFNVGFRVAADPAAAGLTAEPQRRQSKR